ncbi:MAG: V-type ATP synthase subunit A [Thermodesulfovibrionales bacterium]
MIGRIVGISGSTVRARLPGLRLFERVYVGEAMLIGEVVRIDGEEAIIQVYESTSGLSINEPVKGTGMTLTVRLGPGLLSGIFDGLERPLSRLRQEVGPFITTGREIYAIDYTMPYMFYPAVKEGAVINMGDILGYFEEGNLKHPIISVKEGRIEKIASGEITLDSPLVVLDNGAEIFGCHEWPVRIPRPYRRKLPPTIPLITGQRSLDFLFPVAKGGTVIIPGGFGTGKTILEQSIAKFADADIVIYVGCGERGNEMADLIDEFSKLKDPWNNRELMERTIIIANTSNMPVAAREASIYTAVTIAEYYRDMGYNVLLLADSISRWAEALREISSCLEEMPGEEGYPTYLSSRISSFIERAGVVDSLCGRPGSLTMILSVSPPGGDLTEPVTQACLRAGGAFVMLDTSLAHKRHFPAINWIQSYSLYGKEVSSYFIKEISRDWDLLKQRCIEILRREEELKDVVEIVGMEGLQDSDRILMQVAEKVRMEFLCQNAYTEDAFSGPASTISKISSLVKLYDASIERLRMGESIDEILKGLS